MDKDTRQPLARPWRWAFTIILIVLAGASFFAMYKYLVLMRLSSGLQQKAEQAFAGGITILDEQHDFAPMGTKNGSGKPNNPNGYDLGFNDLRSVSLGADDQYLYIKVTFWDVIPGAPPILDGDRIGWTGIKLNITNNDGVDQEIWMLGFGYLPIFNFPTVNTYYFYDPTGIQEPEDKRFSGRGSDSKIIGGAGFDTLIGALPLNQIDLKAGQTIYLNLSMETASDRYDHASVDVLGGQGKMPGLITWALGSNSFEINQDFYKP